MDGFLMYLFAIVVRDLRKQGGSICGMPFELIETSYESSLGNVSERVVVPSTKALLMKSVSLYPCNWSAWLELVEECAGTNIELTENISNNEDKLESSIPSWEEFNISDITDDNEVNDISNQNLNSDIEEESDDDDKFNGTNISNRYNNQSNNKNKSNITKTFTKIMYLCFLVHINLEKHQGDEALLLLQEGSEISSLFPTSQITLIQGALSFYSLRDYDRSQDVFEQARDTDPHRLEHIDTYSHILYVKERKAELSHLAHVVSKADKYSPESCCVVGNYYSLRGSHERSILYFQRALRLNSKNLSVWTLMGHEFIELHNTAAAVQCYRKAVDSRYIYIDFIHLF
jgi:tetratricopeptide (TPR) repeat protein